MNNTSGLIIKPYHWLLTLAIAAALHTLALINFRQTDHINVSENLNHEEIVISLKKLRQPQPTQINPPLVKKQTVVEVPKPEPKKLIQKKPKVVKKPIKKPIVQTVSKPVIEPVIEPKPIITTATKPVIKPTTTHQRLVSSADHEKAINEEKQRYMTKLSIWLSKHKKYPAVARRRKQEGDLTISFVIDRDGNLLRHSIIKPSTHKSLNAAVIKMLERASPMPAVPKKLAANSHEFEYTIPINFSLTNN